MAKLPYKNLKQLGHATPIPDSPDHALLERVPRPYAEHDFVVRFTCAEFTCVCPVTGQPDFAHIVIDYVPSKWLIESKSLKLYFQSFRNYGIFHEPCTLMIGDALLKTLKPQWLRICGYWYPRGGMPIDVFFQKGKLPKSVAVPETGVSPFRGRG